MGRTILVDNAELGSGTERRRRSRCAWASSVAVGGQRHAYAGFFEALGLHALGLGLDHAPEHRPRLLHRRDGRPSIEVFGRHLQMQWLVAHERIEVAYSDGEATPPRAAPCSSLSSAAPPSRPTCARSRPSSTSTTFRMTASGCASSSSPSRAAWSPSTISSRGVSARGLERSARSAQGASEGGLGEAPVVARAVSTGHGSRAVQANGAACRGMTRFHPRVSGWPWRSGRE